MLEMKICRKIKSRMYIHSMIIVNLFVLRRNFSIVNVELAVS